MINIFLGGQPLSSFGINIVPQASFGGAVAAGSFVAQFEIPNTSGGQKELRAVGATSGEVRSAQITIKPKVTSILPFQAEAGETVQIGGNGLIANTSFQIMLAEHDGTNLLTANAVTASITGTSVSDSSGSFTTTIVIPSVLFKSAFANVHIKIKSGSSLESEWLNLGFQVVTRGVSLNLDKTSGLGDAVLTMNGFATTTTGSIRVSENIGPITLRHQFIANGTRILTESELTVSKGAKIGSDIITDTNGQFTVQFPIGTAAQPIAGGNLTIQIAGGSILYIVTPQFRIRDAASVVTTQLQLDKQYTLEGVGFQGNERNIPVTLDGAALTTDTATTADQFGKFTTTFTLPTTTLGGPHTLVGQGTLASATHGVQVVGTITEPATAATSVTRGDKVVVKGRGLGGSQTITATVGTVGVSEITGGTTAADGSFEVTITIPPIAAGTHNLTLTTTTTSAQLANAFTVVSSIAAAPARAKVGTQLTINGNGFGAAEVVTVAIPGESNVSATTDNIGSFSVTLVIAAVKDNGTVVTVSATSATVTTAKTTTFTFDTVATAQAVVIAPATPINAGKVLTVTAEVETGATAKFSIAGIATTTEGVAMTVNAAATAPEGFTAMIGTYTVVAGDNVKDAVVSLMIADVIGNTATVTPEAKVTLDTTAPTLTSAASSEAVVRNGGTFTITVKSETGAAVTAGLSAVDTTKTEAVALTESATEAGTYTATVQVNSTNQAQTGDKVISVTVTDAAGNATTSAEAIAVRLQAETSFTVSLHQGVNMVHVPVKVATIARLSDLFAALGGAADVNLVVGTNANGEFVAFTPNVQVGSNADIALGESSAAIVVMNKAKSVTFSGATLGTDVSLRQGVNVVGIPRSGAAANVSAIKNKSANISLVIREVNGEFISFPTSDAATAGGKGYIVVATAATTVTFDGGAWENTAASAPIDPKAYNTDASPVFVIEGELAREDNFAAVNGLDVTVTNLRTGDVLTQTTGRNSGAGRFVSTFMNLTGERFTVGDTFEMRIADPSGTFGGVRPIRHSLTTDDLRNGRLSLSSILLSVIPEDNALLPNYPNPFNPETWIPFQLSDDADVQISIYNMAGERVRSIELGFLPAGTYSSRSKAAYWDGRNELGERVASGLYIYRIQAGSFVEARRMVILK